VTTTRQRTSAATLIIAAAFAASCATESPPAAQVAASEAAIAMAREAGAARHASPELALAEEKMQLSKRFMSAGDAKPARWLAEQARADAELAAMKAQSTRALAAARELTDETRIRSAALFLGARR